MNMSLNIKFSSEDTQVWFIWLNNCFSLYLVVNTNCGAAAQVVLRHTSYPGNENSNCVPVSVNVMIGLASFSVLFVLTICRSIYGFDGLFSPSTFSPGCRTNASVYEHNPVDIATNSSNMNSMCLPCSEYGFGGWKLSFEGVQLSLKPSYIVASSERHGVYLV